MIPIEFPPGVTNLASKNAKVTNWREAHLIRWDEGITMRPVLGWEKFVLATPASRIRKMHRWMSNANTLYTAYLCEQHCYVEIDGVLVDITPVGGIAPPFGNNAGYGDDLYSEGLYGTPRPGDNRLRMYTPMYSLDNWGQELRVMTSSDGRYLRWSPADPPGTKLTAVAGAPVSNRAFVITPQRHAMLFGMEGAIDKFGWSDEEDDTNWAFADVLSRAGFYDTSPRSPIVTQLLFEGGILMFTGIMGHLITWTGLPYVYTYRPLGRLSVPISPASICETPQGVVWPSVDGWWIFDGTNARVMPCPIWDFIVEHMDVPASRFSASCVHMTNHGEVWWFYADKAEGSLQNFRYAMLDYRNGGIWSMGMLKRTCGFVHANDRFPVMTDGFNVYKHESTLNYFGAEMPWVESHNISPNGGENWLTLNKLLPDVKGDADALRWRVAKTNARNQYTPDVYTPLRSKNGSGYVDIRETARDMRIRMDMVKSADWETVGPILIDRKVRGKK
jgi:hypothetical protein